jgi:prepilin-type N-terminal cleavage/methylation domain-containing protein
MRRGLTLPELLLAIIISGLIMGIALPGVQSLRNQLIVEEAVQQVVAAHRRARTMAILQSQAVVLSVRPDSLSIRTDSGDSLLWTAAGPFSIGAALAGGERRFTFSPVGITTGLSNASLTITREQASRTIVVSRLGRVRVQ